MVNLLPRGFKHTETEVDTVGMHFIFGTSKQSHTMCARITIDTSRH